MLETIEEYRLLLETERRMANVKPEDFITQEEVLSELAQCYLAPQKSWTDFLNLLS